MSVIKRHADRWLLLLVGALVFGGVLVFASGAFGLLARGETHISSVVFDHLVLGVGLGLVALFTASMIDYRHWRNLAIPLFLLSCALTALVFVPFLGIEHSGATRWLDLRFFSFQPAETMKIGAIILAATYFSGIKNKVVT